MKRKKGFTLVELLAVITILAIIGLIATPMVIKYVRGSKEESIKQSLNGIERSALMYFTSENIRNSAVVDLTTNTIEIKNKDISKGLVVGNRESVKIYIYKNGYCGIKTGDNIVVKEVNENECNFNIDDSIEILSTNSISKDKKIMGYRIYGNTLNNDSLGSSNSITLKLKGKNLLDKKQSLLDGIKNESGVTVWAIVAFNNDWVINNLNSNTNYTITFNVECLNVPDGVENKSSNFGFLLYSGVSGYNSSWLNTPVKNFTLGEKYSSNRTITTPNNLLDDAANYRILSYTNYHSNGTNNLFSTMKFTNIQIEEGTEATAYEPYIEPKEYTIEIKEPLRKLGDKVDYIDSSISQIVRNVGVRDDGTLYELETPTYEYIKLPTISNLDGTTVVSASDGNMNASQMEIIVKK